MIRTQRLVLRRARWDDLDDIHAVLSDARAMRYWSTPPHATIEETRDWLGKMIEPGPRLSDDFIIELDGRAVGKAGGYELPFVGFILHPDCWGRGYAREAMAAAIAHIFASHDLPKLCADVDPRNEASLKLLARLGFAETHRAKGTWLVGDELCDSVYFALDRPPARGTDQVRA